MCPVKSVYLVNGLIQFIEPQPTCAALLWNVFVQIEPINRQKLYYKITNQVLMGYGGKLVLSSKKCVSI